MTLKRQLGAFSLALMLAGSAFAYQQPQAQKSQKKRADAPQGPGPHAGDWLRRNINVPPDKQKQELEKDDQFKKLPASQQQQLLNRLNRFNSLRPDQKERVLSHMEWLEHLTPEQRQKADSLHNQFHALAPDRRNAVRKALFNMREMSEPDRRKNIDSPQMKSSFTDQEREIMKGYTELGFPDEHAEYDIPQEP